jgi:hypothetical protein
MALRQMTFQFEQDGERSSRWEKWLFGGNKKQINEKQKQTIKLNVLINLSLSWPNNQIEKSVRNSDQV